MQLEEGFQPHVLELPCSEDPEDGVMLALALVVFRRKSGVLLAVPEDFISGDTLAAGLMAGPEDVIGPSHPVTVQAGVWDPVTRGEPAAADGESITVLLVDCLVDIQSNLKVFDPGADDVSLPELRFAAHGVDATWSECNTIFGEVRRLWKESRLGSDCLVGCNLDGPSSIRQSSCCEGSASLLLVCLEQSAMDGGHLDLGLLL